MNSGFAKPASRNTLVEDVLVLPLDPKYHGVGLQKRHTFKDHNAEKEESSTGIGGGLSHASLAKLGSAVSNTQLRSEYTQKRYHHHHGSRQSHQQLSDDLAKSDVVRTDTPHPIVASPSDASLTTGSTPANSTARRQDALEIFDHFGISRPQGWLSEDGSGTAESLLTVRPQLQRICHACGEVLRDRKYCPHCGHDACVKCTTEVPDTRANSYATATTHHLHHIIEHSSKHSHPVDEAEGKESNSPQSAIYVPLDHETTTRKRSLEGLRTELLELSPAGASSSPRTPKWLLQGNLLSRIQRQDDHSGSSTAVKQSPFLVADRALKGNVTEAQPTMKTVTAEGSPHVGSPHFSDCVSRRHGGESSHGSPSSGKCSDPGCRATHAGHHPFRHSISCGSHRKLYIKDQLEHSKEGNSDQAGVGGETFRTIPAIEVLEKKVNQLYRHAQDLHHSQHIMEHLAAGSKELDRAEYLQRRSPGARRVKLQGTEIINTSPLRTLDNNSTVTHSISTDVKFIDPIDTTTHPLNKDMKVEQEISPKSHRLRHDIRPITATWIKPHSITQDVRVDGSKAPALSWRKSYPLLKAPAGKVDEPDSLPKINPTEQANIDIRSLGQPISTKMATFDTRKQSIIELLRPGSEPHQLRNLDRSQQKQQRQTSPLKPLQRNRNTANEIRQTRIKHEIPSNRVSETTPWLRKPLRKVSQTPDVQAREATATDISSWRHQLRKVQWSEDDVRPKASTPPVAKWRRSLSKPARFPESEGENGKACIFCHPSEFSSSKASDASSRPGTHEHFHVPHEYLHSTKKKSRSDRESLTPRLKLKQVEQSLALKSAEGFVDATTTKIDERVTKKREARHVRHHKTSSHSSYESIARTIERKPLTSNEHLCSWRTRYINLSTEHDQLKTELSSHQSSRQSIKGQSKDAKVGTAFPKCESPKIGIEGLTIVMHMKGKDDLVINTDLKQD